MRALWLSTLLLIAVAPVRAGDLEVEASRAGYNLLWPTTRCCAFELHIAGDGVATVKVNRNDGKEPKTEVQTFTLSREDLVKLRKLIDDNQFFSLPSDVGPWPIDGDEQRITIRVGERSHQVHFASRSSDSSPEQTRAFNVWRGLKAMFTIQGENVEGR